MESVIVQNLRPKYEPVAVVWSDTIPEDTFAPNVIISGVACLKKLNVTEIPVHHRNRQTGEVSIKKIKLLKAALKSFFQTITYRIVNGEN